MLATRMQRLVSSPIREILSAIEVPDMVSFAGGLPSPESFPVLENIDIAAQQLQYGASEGEPALRELVARDLRSRGMAVSAAQVLILSGSQQGIDLVAKVLVETGTHVAVESPTYLAALQVFSLFGAQFVPYTAEDSAAITRAARPVPLVYCNPNFQNPTGHCYSADQRDSLARSVDEAGAVLFEDDPYRDLDYDGCDRSPICARLKHADWVYQSSFSKTLAPGLRLGYMVCSESLFVHFLGVKQAADLHSNRVSQLLVQSLLDDPSRPQKLASLVEIYRSKRDNFEQLLQRHFSDIAQWQKPAGGLFFWLTLTHAPQLDTRLLLQKAIENGVAFMPGEPFYTQASNGTGVGKLRLNFSHANDTQAQRGLETLAKILRQAIKG